MKNVCNFCISNYLKVNFLGMHRILILPDIWIQSKGRIPEIRSFNLPISGLFDNRISICHIRYPDTGYAKGKIIRKAKLCARIHIPQFCLRTILNGRERYSRQVLEELPDGGGQEEELHSSTGRVHPNYLKHKLNSYI